MEDLDAQVAQLAPWVTKFDFAGKTYGGSYDGLNDDRVSRLPEFFPQCRRIMEVGCLEGAHTVILSRGYPYTEIVAIDGRPTNLAKAQLLTKIYGCKKVKFALEDLETADLAKYGHFEVIVCLGLLYHLAEPWHFLRRVSAQTNAIWVWTTICNDTEATTTLGGYKGRIYVEGDPDDPRTALREKSFFPTLGSLVQMFRDAGFLDFKLMNFENTPNGPSVMVAATKQPFRLPGL